MPHNRTRWLDRNLNLVAAVLAILLVGGYLYTQKVARENPAIAVCNDPVSGRVFDAKQYSCSWVLKDKDGFLLSQAERSRLRCRLKEGSPRPSSCIGF